MMSIKRSIFLLLGVFSALGAFAQMPQTPYSRYGYGVLGDNATSAQRAMGGIGYAMNSGRQINVMNPASYAAIDSLTFLFDMGVDINNLWTTEGDNKGTKMGGGLNYITLQVPLTRYGGASIGFLPYSTVNYAFGETVNNGQAAYQGSGGLSQLYLGLAAKPFKGFTAGLNISYLFGTLKHDNLAYTTTGSISLFERVFEVRDYMLQFGLQYSYQINRRNRLTAGVTFTPGKSFHGHSFGLQFDQSFDQSADTIGYTSMKGKYTQPASWGAGLNWQWNERLMIEGDFTYQPWSKAKYTPFEGYDANTFVDRYKVSFGSQYMVNPRGSYSQRIQYRAGVSFSRDYWMVLGNTVREYSVSAGVGLPAPGNKTMINLTVEYQHRQGHPQALIQEKYLFLTLGVNFNELWFWQNRIR